MGHRSRRRTNEGKYEAFDGACDGRHDDIDGRMQPGIQLSDRKQRHTERVRREAGQRRRHPAIKR